MAKANRICYTDNMPYYYCPSCPSERKKEAFYNMFCCERCSKIFELLTQENFKHISTEQCKKELIALNVSKDEVFKNNISLHIQRVLDYQAPAEAFDAENPKDEVSTKKIKIAPIKRTNKNSEVD